MFKLFFLGVAVASMSYAGVLERQSIQLKAVKDKHARNCIDAATNAHQLRTQIDVVKKCATALKAATKDQDAIMYVMESLLSAMQFGTGDDLQESVNCMLAFGDYFSKNPEGVCLYNHHFATRLANEFPKSSFAAEVNYNAALDRPRQIYECEGSFSCELTDLSEMLGFLLAFPLSTYTKDAVTEVVNGLNRIANYRQSSLDDPGNATYERKALEYLVERAESVAKKLNTEHQKLVIPAIHAARANLNSGTAGPCARMLTSA